MKEMKDKKSTQSADETPVKKKRKYFSATFAALTFGPYFVTMAFAAFSANSFSWAGALTEFSVLLIVNLVFADLNERARAEEERERAEEERAASRPPR